MLTPNHEAANSGLSKEHHYSGIFVKIRRPPGGKTAEKVRAGIWREKNLHLGI